MASGKIPVAQSREKLNVETSPTAQVDERSSTSGSMFAELGRGLGDIAGQLEKAHSLAEMTKAENHTKLKLAELELRRTQDPDISEENQKKYIESADLIINEASEMVSIPFNRDIFKSEAGAQAGIAKIRLKQDFMQKTVSQAKGNFDTFLDAQYKDFIGTDNPKLQEMAILRRDRKIDQMAEAGFITREEQAKLKTELPTKWNEGYAQNEAYTNPQKFLDKEAKGYYKGVDPKKIETLRASAQNIMDRNNREAERAQKALQNQTEGEFGQRIVAGQLPIDEINNAEVLKKISPEYANILRKYLESPKAVVAQDKAETYSNLLQEYVSLANKGQTKIVENDFGKLALFRQHVIEAGAAGAITKPKMEKWLNTINPKFQKGLDEAYRNSALVKKSAFSFLGNWTDSHLISKDERDQAKMDLVDALMTRINEEENAGPIKPQRAAELAQEVLGEYVRSNYPELMGAKEMTNAVANKKDGVNPVYPGDTTVKADKLVGQKKTEYKVGDVITVGDKKYQVKKLSPDGNHELEESK